MKGGETLQRIFYADFGLVVSVDLEWLQGAFDTLNEIFDRVLLRTNIGETVGTVCHP